VSIARRDSLSVTTAIMIRRTQHSADVGMQEKIGPIKDDASAAPAGSRISCRQIYERDLDSIIELFRRGFPERKPEYWVRGLQRHALSVIPAGYPRYGYLLEKDDAPVGAILVLCSLINVHGETKTRCNLSSWYVEPRFRCYASMLIAAAIRNTQPTYVNVSPAPHTWSTIEAQGFACYCNGQFFSVPIFSKRFPHVLVEEIKTNPLATSVLPLVEQKIVMNHSDYGCLSLILAAPDGVHPFVFLPFRLKVACITVPCMHLVYCRSIPEFARFAGHIGVALLRRRTFLVAVDADGPLDGLVGLYRGKSRMYFKGPDEPRHGDLIYTERVLFGP
jgi:hypothetical protein